MSDARGETVHGTAIAIGEAGVLIRGPSGAGKSRLALALVTGGLATSVGTLPVRLVADDRVMLAAQNDRLVARPHPAIAGKLEVRGYGIVTLAHEPAAVLRAVIDLIAGEPTRLPDPAETRITLLGLALPRHALPARLATPGDVAAWWHAAGLRECRGGNL